MKDFTVIADDYRSGAKALQPLIPDTWQGFTSLVSAGMKDGAIPRKHKELMSVAIGIADHCDGCIALHTQSAIKAGASREEFAEMVGVALLMGGGPSSVYGIEALQAYDHFVGGTQSASE